jgi:hypothetical protein
MFGWGRKAKVRSVFSKIVSPNVVKELLSAEGFKGGEFRPVDLGVFLIMVGGADVPNIAAGVSRIPELASRNEAMVWSVIGPLVALSLGAVHESWVPLDQEALRKLISEIVSPDAGPVKLVHWQGMAHVGLFGGEIGTLTYSVVFPEFDRMFSTLGRLEFGQVVEFTEH